MKKLSITLLSLALMGSLATGCGGAKQDSSAEASGKSDGKKTTIKLHSWYTEDMANWKNTIAEFEKKNPDIHVEVVGLSDKGDAQEYLKKLDILAASGEDLDVVMFSNSTYLTQRASIGLLEPLDDLLKKDGITNLKDEYNLDTQINGKYYALPGKYNEYITILNKAQLDEANLPVPTKWTWDEFMDYSKKLTKGEGPTKRYGTYFHNWIQHFTVALNSDPQNNKIITKDGTQNLDNPLLKKSLQIVNQMENVDKTAFPYSEIISQKMNYRNVYFGQKASMLTIGSYMIPEVAGTDVTPATFKTAFAPYPQNNANDPSYTPVTGDYLSVAANSKNKEAAYKFIRWYSTEGIPVQGKFLSSWKKADISKEVDTILKQSKNPDMVDKESLIRVLSNDKGVGSDVPVGYLEEAQKVFMSETEKYLLGQEELDSNLKSAKEKVQKVIDSNKK